MKYLPFLNGIYSTSPGLTANVKAVAEWDKMVFQIDEQYEYYLHNKSSCRHENISKYYLEKNLMQQTIAEVNQYIVRQLLKEYPAQFSLEEVDDHFILSNNKTKKNIIWSRDWIESYDNGWKSLFDALCCQVQEDLAIVQLNKGGREYLAAIHLCAPNHWSPGSKVGMPFDHVHEPVPGMEKVMAHYEKLLENIVTTQGPYTRFAWGISTDIRLNHHPEPPPGINVRTWHGRDANEDHVKFFIRTERQNLVGFPNSNSFLFTIRTYFYEVDKLSIEEKQALLHAVNSMSVKTLSYKGLTSNMLKMLYSSIGGN